MNNSLTPLPAISGPLAFSRRQRAVPLFRIDLGSPRYFAVELSSDPKLFDPDSAGLRTADNYFASWDSGLLGPVEITTFVVPEDVWSRLRSAPALYYRVFSSASAGQWDASAVSTAGTELQRLPKVMITDDPPTPNPRSGSVSPR